MSRPFLNRVSLIWAKATLAEGCLAMILCALLPLQVAAQAQTGDSTGGAQANLSVPPLPPVLIGTSCSSGNIRQRSNEITAAFDAKDWSSLDPMSLAEGETMGRCASQHANHPFWLILKAEFFALSALASHMAHPSVQDSPTVTTRLAVAETALQTISRYNIDETTLASQVGYGNLLTLKGNAIKTLGHAQFFAGLAPSAPQTATVATAIPVEVLDTYGGFLDASHGDYTIRCGVSFKNVTSQTIVAVKWHVLFVDAFDNVLQTETVDSLGSFSPNVVIEPKRAMNGVLQTAPEFGNTDAWDLFNAYDKQVVRFRFLPVAVRFEDGTIWNSPAT